MMFRSRVGYSHRFPLFIRAPLTVPLQRDGCSWMARDKGKQLMITFHARFTVILSYKYSSVAANQHELYLPCHDVLITEAFRGRNYSKPRKTTGNNYSKKSRFESAGAVHLHTYEYHSIPCSVTPPLLSSRPIRHCYHTT